MPIISIGEFEKSPVQKVKTRQERYAEIRDEKKEQFERMREKAKIGIKDERTGVDGGLLLSLDLIKINLILYTG